MPLVYRKKDLPVALTMVGIGVAVVGYCLYGLRAEQKELEAVAEQLGRTYLSEQANPDAYEFVYHATAERTMGLIGQPLGRIDLWIREAGDVSLESFHGLEHIYAKRDENWILLESGLSTHKSHHLEGYKTFAELDGVEFDPAVDEFGRDPSRTWEVDQDDAR